MTSHLSSGQPRATVGARDALHIYIDDCPYATAKHFPSRLCRPMTTGLDRAQWAFPAVSLPQGA